MTPLRGRNNSAPQSPAAGADDLTTTGPLAGPVARIETDAGVIKFWLARRGGDLGLATESVLIPMRSYHGADWYTLCLSSQIGCRMGCTFCETGRMGWQRDLTADDILRQYHVAADILRRRHGVDAEGSPAAIRNIVFMGMGEPFDNWDAVLAAIRAFTDRRSLDLPMSRICVSTVGHIGGLRRLADLIRSPTSDRAWGRLRLAISLTAADDQLRDYLVPLNRRTPLRELRQTLLDFPLPPRGRFLIEYVMLAGVNDTPACADAVAAWCRPLRCTVNLIPYNPQRGAPYQSPDDGTVLRFLARLRQQSIFAKRRVTQGRRLFGACGQLGSERQRSRRPG